MKGVVRRLAESGGRASGTAFLAGLAVGAVVVVAVGQLLGSDEAIVRAAAVVPLIAALVMVGVAMAVGLSGASLARAEPAAAAPESAEGGRTDGRATADPSDPFDSEDTPATSGPRDSADATDPFDLLDAQHRPDLGDAPDPRNLPDPRNPPDPRDPPDPGDPSPAPPLPPDPAPGEPVTPTSVVEAWAHYRRNGDGFFTAQGLQRQFGALGVAARVRDGSDVDAGGDVLVVEADPPDPGGFFVVPSFVKSPGAAPEWFDDAGDGALSARTQTIHKLAEGKWTDTSFEVVQKGSIS